MAQNSFAGIESKYATLDNSSIWLQSIPFDGTSTWGKGADKGFNQFIGASTQLELYDIETDYEVYRKGIHILPELSSFDDANDMYDKVFQQTRSLLKSNKFLTFFGGEHSISIGIIRAFREKYKDLTVLQLDAHADLRQSYNGSSYNHACAMHAASIEGDLLQVGIRSMDVSEKEFLNVDRCFFAHDIERNDTWMDKSIQLMSDQVYISLDLDVFDPCIMPSTGTPEPGGLGWYQILKYLRKVFEAKEVVGFDIVELAPIEGLSHPEFLVAKLYYKMLSYKFK